MAKQPYSANKAKATQIKIETVDSANSALRVGTWMENLNDSAIQEWDSGAAYAAGQIVVFEGALAQVTTATTAGQSPVTHAVKWSRKIIIDSSGIALGNYNAVSGNALKQLINSGELGGSGGGSVPNATTEVFGKVRFATEQEQIEGVVPDAASTPKGTYALLRNLDFIQKTLLELFQAASTVTTEHPSELPAVKSILSLKLYELSELVAHGNMTISDAFNLIFDRPYGTSETDRGMYHRTQQPDGTWVIDSFVGRSVAGSVVLSRGLGNEQVRVTESEVQINSPALNASTSALTIRTGGRTILPVADPTKGITNFLISQPIPTGGYQDVFVTLQQLVPEIFPALLPLLQPYFNSGTGSAPPGDNWIIEEVCEFIETVPAPPYQNITLANPTNGQSIEHNMQSTQLWVPASTNTNVSFTFPDTDHVVLNLPEGLVLTTLTFKLEPQNA